MAATILVVDDEAEACELLQAALEARGYRVTSETSARAAVEAFQAGEFDLVITDLNLGDSSGLDVCRQMTEIQPGVPSIVVTAFGDVNAAVGALRAGAYDFISKPIEIEALLHSVGRAIAHRRLSEEVKRLTAEVKSARGTGELVGQSRPMKAVYDLIQRVCNSDASVIITGESGTGKELVARALHFESDRATGPFKALNCAAVPAQLLESELFGHVKGAFTDAKVARRGLFQDATGGTVFLDEVGEMPLDMQAKLLRVLQERKVRPVGANGEESFDARVISATNRDLEAEVEEGRFREDLFYRLNVVQIHMPPLRARGNDILLLAQHFVERVAGRSGKPVKGISSDAAKKLLAYDWPGNVRQLENWMERAVALTSYDQITVGDLPDKVQHFRPAESGGDDLDAEHMLTMQEVENRHIERVLRATGGNKAQAARILGMDRRTLYRKLDREAAST
jgi:two-component system, NtrC family, response regulator HydG